MNTRLKLSADQPTPLFASLTWFERTLMGATVLWVAFGTPYILFTLWSIR